METYIPYSVALSAPPNIKFLKLEIDANNLEKLKENLVKPFTNLEGLEVWVGFYNKINNEVGILLKSLVEDEDSLTILKKIKTLKFNNTHFTDRTSIIGQLDQLESLTFNSCGNIASLPENLGNLKNLKELILYNNVNLVSLPTSFGQLLSLEILSIDSHRKLKYLPDEIGNLTNLRELTLRDNPNLTHLPNSIQNLKALTVLHLGGNRNLNLFPTFLGELIKLETLIIQASDQLKKLPNEIGNLKNLRELTLRNNLNLTDLPEGIQNLKALTVLHLENNRNLNLFPTFLGDLINLKTLIIQANDQLKSLPDEIGNLKKLKRLKLSSSYLKKIPLSITNLNNLKHLDLSNNQLTSLPEKLGQLGNLSTLNLEGNQLNKIPETLNQLKKLTTLNLSKNPIKLLPSSLADLIHLEKLTLINTKIDKVPYELLVKENLKIHPNMIPEYLYINKTNIKSKEIYNNFLLYVQGEFEKDPQLSIKELWQLLAIDHKEFHMQACNYLEKYVDNPLHNIQDISNLKVYLLGEPKNIKKATLTKKIKQAGIKIAKKFSKDVTHVIVGYKPEPTFDKILETDVNLVLSQHFITFLDNYHTHEQGFLEEIDQDSQNNLIQLLLSKDEINQGLGLEMMQQGGIPTNLLYHFLLVKWMIKLLDIQKDNRILLEKLTKKYLPPSWHLLFEKIAKKDFSFNKLFTSSQLDQTALLKAGIEMFKGHTRFNHFYFEFLGKCFAIDASLADQEIISLIENNRLDLRNLVYPKQAGYFVKYEQIKWPAFDGSKYSQVEELWLSSGHGEVHGNLLPIIKSLPNLKKIKVYIHAIDESEFPIKQPIWEKKFPTKEITLLKY